MRTALFFATFFAFMSGAFAQGINYQALARNAGGSPIANQPITAEISIFPDAASATSLYTENHNLSTDAYGLFNLVIGAGTPAAGSFDAVDWSNAPLYLGVRLNTGSGFTDLGRHPFQGTPFSFYAPEAGKAIDMKLSDLTDVQTAAPANGQVLKWNGSSWGPAADNSQAYTAGTGISINGNTIANTGDLSNTNELQNLTISGNQLSISNGNTVTLPTGAGGDNWGTQTVASDATLSGLGTPASPLKLAQQSAANGQVLKWNGSIWAPAADNGQTYIAGTGISINGNTIINTGDTNPNDDITTATQAGGDLSGPFSNLQINANAVGTNEIANGSITAADLAAGVLPTTLPPSGSAGGDLGGTYPNPVVDGLQGRPVANTVPANGQVLRWSGAAWEPATPSGGSSVWSTNGTSAFYNTGNVGVGTNTPHNRMQLHNSDIFAGSPSALQLTNNNTGTAANDGLLLTLNSTVADFGLIGGLMMRENAPLGFGTNNNYHLFLKESGLLGLGTFAPQGKMEIGYNSTSHANPHLTLTHSSNGFSRISLRSDVAANKYWTIAARTQAGDASSQFNLFYHNGTSGQDILSLSGSGNVGIGTTDPQRPLHIHFNNANTSTGQLLLSQAGTGNAWMNIGLTNGVHYAMGVDNADSDKFKIGYSANSASNVGSNARLTIDNAGNIGVGTTTPAARLDVAGTINTNGELNRTATGAANLAPICYGNIASNGAINTGTGNYSITKTSTGIYEATITGENFFFDNYIVQVTLIGVAGLVSTSSVNGKLLIRTYDLGVGAVPADRNFSFVVFKP